MFKIVEKSVQRAFPLIRLQSTATQALAQEKLQTFRTGESNPEKHTSQHLGQYYKIPEEVRKKLFTHGGIPKTFAVQTKTFNELCLMVREPAVDIISCLNLLDESKACLKFVLYGKVGTGKSLTLAHILHYGSNNGYLLVHVPWVCEWMRRCREYSDSETKEGFVDLNLDAAAWLMHFKTQNADLLQNPELKLSEDVVWTKRESTVKDSPLLELVEHGINRVKFASDTVVVLAEEIKKLAGRNACKALVCIDGYNAFFYPKTTVRTEKKEKVPPSKITLTEAFLNLTKSDWNNSAVILTVDELVANNEDKLSYLPKYLLSKEGFEHIDPFVPILVPNYSAKELGSCLDYYKERLWIQNRERQEEELAFLSGHNPYKLMQFCNPL